MEDTIEIPFDWGRLQRLMDSHGLNHTEATQVVRGTLCFDRLSHRKRRKEHLQAHRDRCSFAKALRDGRPRVFAMHGHQVELIRVKAVRRYEVDYIPLGPDLKPCGEVKSVHKLAFKMGGYMEHVARIQSSITMCRFETRVANPIEKPQHRYFISDKKLFGWVDAANVICVKTLEGEMVRGTLSWIGRWELGLNVEGVELVVFRHALSNIQGFRWGSSKGD